MVEVRRERGRDDFGGDEECVRGERRKEIQMMRWESRRAVRDSLGCDCDV